jgi:uncharacterized membrane protein
MPQVIVERFMSGVNPDEIWKIARKVTDFPKFMDHVTSVDLVESDENRDITSWEVLFNGSELRWIENSVFDNNSRRTQFNQLEGDLAEWKGFFEVLELSNGVLARYQIEFDVGVPALAAELDPLCEQAIRVNCEQMLEKMEMHSRCLSKLN